jgi:hypothetical protein
MSADFSRSLLLPYFNEIGLGKNLTISTGSSQATRIIHVSFAVNPLISKDSVGLFVFKDSFLEQTGTFLDKEKVYQLAYENGMERLNPSQPLSEKSSLLVWKAIESAAKKDIEKYCSLGLTEEHLAVVMVCKMLYLFRDAISTLIRLHSDEYEELLKLTAFGLNASSVIRFITGGVYAEDLPVEAKGLPEEWILGLL